VHTHTRLHNSDSQMETTACTGNFRVHRGKWTIPNGKTAHECTYCEWCVANQCIQLEAGYTTKRDLANCLCDCPIKHTHAAIQAYNCGKHEEDVSTCDMGTCRTCWKLGTTSGSERYCEACSALFGICGVCGVTARGKYPMRTVTKMLAAENGRGGSTGDDDDDEDSQ
jgi:hypothetical protein